ncbi:hypothetical protein DXV76_06775 [Rhodobacteraceae bacterium CCMM004]|nr:hypothetical protein DXV76_06775 [Rhodobacteraceae bacterium CCMM004]
MTVIDLSQAESRAGAILAQAEEQYLEILQDLKDLRLYAKDRTDLSETEIKRVLAEYRRATLIVFEERKKLEDFRKRQTGADGDHAIDFAAVRDEIGRRLDRLRRAQDAD